MDKQPRSRSEINLSTGPRPPRIETQIHRRKKAKALSPLTPEWEGRSTRPPAKLRMPANRMRKSP
jgi:hypothetical protein